MEDQVSTKSKSILATVGGGGGGGGGGWCINNLHNFIHMYVRVAWGGGLCCDVMTEPTYIIIHVHSPQMPGGGGGGALIMGWLTNY